MRIWKVHCIYFVEAESEKEAWLKAREFADKVSSLGEVIKIEDVEASGIAIA
ncbi:MAG: hypothetical protein QXL78_01745 [Methanocellales archaeon]